MMDQVTLVLTGAQSLVSQILSDGWERVRAWLSKRLDHHDGTDPAALVQQLDAAYDLASTLPILESGIPSEAPKRLVLEAYWTGFLAAFNGSHSELTAALTDLANGAAAASSAKTVNTMTGTVGGHMVQVGDIEGGIRFS